MPGASRGPVLGRTMKLRLCDHDGAGGEQVSLGSQATALQGCFSLLPSSCPHLLLTLLLLGQLSGQSTRAHTPAKLQCNSATVAPWVPYHENYPTSCSWNSNPSASRPCILRF